MKIALTLAFLLSGCSSFGAGPLPELIVVRKRRELFLLDNVRIHLDTVESIGTFLEFEALVTPNHTVADCHAAIDRLRAAFMPALGEPIACSYADLLLGSLGALEAPDPR